MHTFAEVWPYLVVLFICAFMMTTLILRSRRPTYIPSKEKIAYTTRLLTNLIPIALILITDAEIQFGRGTGKFKRSWVIDELYKRVPDEYKKYITEDNLDQIITTVLPKAESLWTDNPQFLQPFDMGSART